MRRYGFTLIELSIVLVIIGLIIGGVLLGRDLIKAAQIRDTVGQLQEVETAVHAFREKYQAFPGDMVDATSIWGAQDGGDGLGTDCTQVESFGELTCNGDGSGDVRQGGFPGINYEIHRFWQHLALGGLIAGQYTGVGNNPVNQNGSNVGINTPEFPFSNAGLQIRWEDAVGGANANYYVRPAGHVYYFGIAYNANPHNSFLTPADAWNVDIKIDDGKPGKGLIHTYKLGAPAAWTDSENCATDADPDLAEYDLTRDEILCALIIYNKF